MFGINSKPENDPPAETVSEAAVDPTPTPAPEAAPEVAPTPEPVTEASAPSSDLYTTLKNLAPGQSFESECSTEDYNNVFSAFVKDRAHSKPEYRDGKIYFTK